MIIPTDMTIEQFSRALAYEYGNVPRLVDPSEWQIWASNLQLSSAFSSYDLPSPYLLNNQKEWMEVFTGVIN